MDSKLSPLIFDQFPCDERRYIERCCSNVDHTSELFSLSKTYLPIGGF